MLTDSMFEVVPDAEAAYAYCSRYFPARFTDGMKGLCLQKNGETIAAVIFDEYNGQNIFMHCAGSPGKNWLNRHFLHEAFKHPFITLKCKRITLWISKRNLASRKFATHLGFTQEAKLEKAGSDGDDIIIYRMFRENCKYA